VPLEPRVFEDSKFYGKPIAITFTSKTCDLCETVFQEISNDQDIKKRFIVVKVRADDDLPYFVRLTRGILPSVSVIDHEGNLLSLIESSNSGFVKEKLMLTYERLDKLVKVDYSFVPSPKDFELIESLDVVNQILAGVPGDFRAYQFITWLSSVDKEYQAVRKAFRPADKFSESLVKGVNVPLEGYSSEWGIAIDLGLSKDYDELLSYVEDDGKVRRGKEAYSSGLLIDQAYVGNGLLTAYQATGIEKYLEAANKVFRWTVENLSHEMGFRDVRPQDPVTSRVVIEALMNSEFAVFAARLWLLTGSEEALKASDKAIRASAHRRDVPVLSRLGIAKLKLDYGYLARNCSSLQCETARNLECEYKFRGTCYSSLSEIEDKIRAF